ncbi:C-type lectin domain family 2 member D [Chelonia mydas]|uniref:C-type lectin domain family 2 member D n=1 Tax=Chelonia mydas TaxID=8469 RepID=M7CL12_CHEMY|nr:C-type lectin domain family 2 member D [Chelonia mydas]
MDMGGADFLLRYKGFLDRWIGLQREPGQPWRWPNGTEFDQRFPIRGGGDCAFLMDEDWFGSSRCSTWRRWICSKPDPYTMWKGGGDCAFLMDEDWFGSSRCSTWRRWICSKPDPYTMWKQYAVELKLSDS